MSSLKEIVDPKYSVKAYQVKFGNAIVNPQGETKINGSQLRKKMEKCLESSPLITKVHEVGLGAEVAQGFSNGGYELKDQLAFGSFRPYIFCSINLPPKNQEIGKIKESIASPATVDWTSEFTLVHDGSIYLILREITLSKDIYPGAEDVRDLVLETFRKEKSLKVSSIAPNPLREELILVFLAESDETISFLGKTFEETEACTYFYLSEKLLKNFDQLGALLMRMVNFTLARFYETASKHAKIEEYRSRLEEIHGSMRKIIAEAERIPFFDLYKHYKESKKLEHLVAKHFSSLLDYTLGLEELREWTESVQGMLNNDILLRNFQTRLMADLKHEKIDVDTLTRCADYGREITQRSYTGKITLVGILLTIILSIVGSIIIDYLKSIL